MTHTTRRPALPLALAAGMLLTGLPIRHADAQWVFVARKVLGRVEQLSQLPQGGRPGYEVATVVLDAPAARVYATAVKLIGQNQAVRITGQDAAERRVDMIEGDRTATLRVVALSDKVSQLMIVGSNGPGEDSTTSRVVAGVLRVCREMHRQCSVGG